MTKRFRLTEQAERDVLEIWEYVAANSVVAADRLVDRITETFERLAYQPGIGIPQEEHRLGLRCFPVGKYLVFYSSTTDGIDIYRVLHGARRLEELL